MHRGLRQQLEALSLAGLTHLPKAGPIARFDVPDATAAASPVRVPDSPAPAPETAARAPARNKVEPPAPAMPAPAQKSRIAGEPQPSAPDVPHRMLSPAERQSALAILAEQVKACNRCSELARTRTQTVFGVGDPQARIMFIGEAPGADEDAQGEPFVGKAGQLLNKIITASKLVREQLYICNILKCRPPGNRTPAEDECANCREYLLGQLRTIDPEYIVCWGAVAAQNLLGTKLSVGKLRGRFMTYGRAKVLATYHPSYLLRNPAAKKDVWEDMQFLMADMGVNLSQA